MLELYEKLKPEPGAEEAGSLLECMESAVERRAATNEDLARTETSVREEVARVRASRRQRSLRSKPRCGRRKVRAGLPERTFAFRVGDVAALARILFALLRPAGGR